jgi:hypothetical protein
VSKVESSTSDVPTDVRQEVVQTFVDILKLIEPLIHGLAEKAVDVLHVIDNIVLRYRSQTVLGVIDLIVIA